MKKKERNQREKTQMHKDTHNFDLQGCIHSLECILHTSSLPLGVIFCFKITIHSQIEISL